MCLPLADEQLIKPLRPCLFRFSLACRRQLLFDQGVQLLAPERRHRVAVDEVLRCLRYVQRLRVRQARQRNPATTTTPRRR